MLEHLLVKFYRTLIKADFAQKHRNKLAKWFETHIEGSFTPKGANNSALLRTDVTINPTFNTNA